MFLLVLKRLFITNRRFFCFINMKVFDTGNTHTITFIPRFYGTPTVIEFRDEFTDDITTVNTFTSDLKGYYKLTFNNTFSENDKGEIKILDGTEVIYRGAYIVTDQDTQAYNLTNNEYEFYE